MCLDHAVTELAQRADGVGPDSIIVLDHENRFLLTALRHRNGRLRLRFSHTADLVGTVEHWAHDTFLVRWDQRWLNADAFLSFALDEDGNIREARMVPASELTDFSFDFQDLRLAPVKPDAKP